MTEEKKNCCGQKEDSCCSEKEKEERCRAEEDAEEKDTCSGCEDVKDEAPAEEGDAPDTEKTAEDEALETKYLRLMADFQNYKRRTESSKADIYARANETIVTRLLEVVDNFERALEHRDSEAGAEKFAEGMELIYKQLMDVLDKSGAKVIEAEGAEFDPNFHSAVLMEDSDEVESGHITGVLQKGYTLNGKVIRPAMVRVAN